MYGYNKKTELNYEDAVQKTRDELQKEGFGVLTEIDVKETLKKKLDVHFEKYIILGACNPHFAYKALKAERDIGLMLPCNVIIYEQDKNVRVSSILPTIAMGMMDNGELKNIAAEIEAKLKKAVDSI